LNLNLFGEIMNYALSAMLIRKAVDAAEQSSVAASVVVVDRSGKVVASARMDGSNYLAMAIAQRKATTAAVLGMPSQQFADFVSGDPVVLSAMSSDPEIVLLGGGLPVIVDGNVVGAIGVSGADQQTDISIGQRACETSSDGPGSPRL
jgi:glc operon protein GlcG